ncbi:MAG: hypothetical protein NZU63_13895 [Gemmataceae bacterium]|nr:hypothetical protein [Gemmataceae bacterium]MDW8242926.1 hypothetical protein [Thermogemmata sp.]
MLRIIIPISFCLGLIAWGGCGPGDQIRTYTAPRDKEGIATEPGNAGGDSSNKKVRLLGLIIPKSSNESWFVKFSGPAEQIEPHVAAFDAFIRTLRVPAGATVPLYEPPPGWREGPPRAMRIVTFLPPGEGKQPELYLSQPFGGSLLDNVNRWRGEVGLPPAQESELPKIVSEVMLGEVKAYRVDFTGPGGKNRMPPFAR